MPHLRLDAPQNAENTRGYVATMCKCNSDSSGVFVRTKSRRRRLRFLEPRKLAVSENCPAADLRFRGAVCAVIATKPLSNLFSSLIAARTRLGECAMPTKSGQRINIADTLGAAA